MKNFILNIIIRIIIFVLLGVIINNNYAQTKNSILKLNSDEYLRDNGDGYLHGGQSIWAWLENNDTTKAQQIHDIIQFWGTVGEPGEPYLWRWRINWDLTCVLLYRVLFQYGNIISESDSIFLENKFLDFIKGPNFNKYNFNNRIYDYTLRYLYSQHHKNINVYYPSGLPNFGWEGRYYVPGNYYNSYKISRDWLFWRFYQLAFKGNYELDGYYTMAMIVCLYTIYDFSINEEIKKRAKMILDLLLLDSTLDFSAGLHGGWLGRNYPYSVMAGQPNIYQWIYWRKGPDPGGSVLGSLYDAYVSTYQPPGIIEDIGILKEEPDNYWHINIESNHAGGINDNQCKWTYVTKFYNMGGTDYSLNRGWQLNIASNNEAINYPHHLIPVKSIKIWINDNEELPEYEDQGLGLVLGSGGYQYKNYLLVKINNPFLHFGGIGNVFDIDETISDWRFLKEERVAVALQMTSSVSAIEVCTIGVDYNSYEDFKNAILNNAQIIPGYNAKFINSHGDTLMNDGYQTIFNGEKIQYFSDKRIYTETNSGENIVSWNNGVMTVQKHGRKIEYNFNKWTYEHIGSSKPLPPIPISINKINNCFDMNFSSIDGVSFYNVYRDTIPEFMPDTINGSNRVGSAIMNTEYEDSINFIDTLHYVPSSSIFYKVTSASGTESNPSPVMGEYRYPLYTSNSTNFNSIAIPFKTDNISNAVELCNMIPYSNSVAIWDAVNQTFIQYVKGLNINNFNVHPGYPYHVNITKNSYFSLVGIPADTSYNLITTPGTDFNEIMLPLNKSHVTKASQLVSEIPHCNSIAVWNSKKQYYKQYIEELPFTDFNVRVGYPYLVNMTADIIWPGGGTPKIMKKLSNEKILFRRKRIPHIVWGEFDSEVLNTANKNKITQFDAFILSNPHEIINQDSPNCTLQNSYWIAQIGNFPSGWKTGDTLCVEFTNNAGNIVDSIQIILSSESSDKAECTSKSHSNNIPEYFDMKQNHPNPFNQETLIQYEIPTSSEIKVNIYNIKGQKIRVLINKEVTAGYHSIRWDGTDNQNNRLGSGIYFINMKTEKFSKTIKVLLVR